MEITSQDKIRRTINGLNIENWSQFTYLAKRLNLTQSELFDEMLRFYFEANKDKMKDLLMTIKIQVVPKSGGFKVSPACASDLQLVKDTMSLPTPNLKRVDMQLTWLAEEYLTIGTKHGKKDTQAVSDFVALGREWLKERTKVNPDV